MDFHVDLVWPYLSDHDGDDSFNESIFILLSCKVVRSVLCFSTGVCVGNYKVDWKYQTSPI